MLWCAKENSRWTDLKALWESPVDEASCTKPQPTHSNGLHVLQTTHLLGSFFLAWTRFTLGNAIFYSKSVYCFSNCVQTDTTHNHAQDHIVWGHTSTSDCGKASLEVQERTIGRGAHPVRGPLELALARRLHHLFGSWPLRSAAWRRVTEALLEADHKLILWKEYVVGCQRQKEKIQGSSTDSCLYLHYYFSNARALN